MSARSQRKDNSEQFDTLLRFPLTPSIANYVLAFMADYDLADLHSKYGAASRDTFSQKIRAKRLPNPVLTGM